MRTHASGGGANRGRWKMESRLCIGSREPNVELQLTNLYIMTWANLSHRLDPLSHVGAPEISMFFNKKGKKKYIKFPYPVVISPLNGKFLYHLPSIIFEAVNTKLFSFLILESTLSLFNLIILFFFNVYSVLRRETETEHKWGRGRERRRHRI